jgi:hypothetical protein
MPHALITCFYRNEGRNVTRLKTLHAAEDEAVSLGCVDRPYEADSGNAETLVHLHGRPFCTSKLQVDHQFAVQSYGEHGKKIHREVQMYQWLTQSHTEQRNTHEKDREGPIPSLGQPPNPNCPSVPDPPLGRQGHIQRRACGGPP